MPLPASSHYTHPECKSAFDCLANRNVIDIISCSQFPLEVIEIVKISRSSLLGDNVPLFSPVHGLSICPLWWIKLMWFSPKLLKHRRWVEKPLNNVQYKTVPSGCSAPRLLGGNMDTFHGCIQYVDEESGAETDRRAHKMKTQQPGCCHAELWGTTEECYNFKSIWRCVIRVTPDALVSNRCALFGHGCDKH